MVFLVQQCLLLATVIVHAPEFGEFAEYYRGLAYHLSGQEPVVVADSITAMPEQPGTRYYFGTPESRYYRDVWQGRLPFSFSNDTVFLADSFLVADDYVLQCGITGTDGEAWELAICHTPAAVTGISSRYGHDFTLARQRDGVMYEQDLTAFGSLCPDGSDLVISDINWQQNQPRPLATLQAGCILFRYDTTFIQPAEAELMARLGSVVCRAYGEIGIALPDPTIVFATQSTTPTGGYGVYSHPFNTIWWRFSDRNTMRCPVPPACPVYTIGHELARVALQPLSDEYPQKFGADDWSHYAPMMIAAPAVWAELGDSAWFEPYDYLSTGPQRFERLYAGTKTFAWLLHEIAQKHGMRLIGEAARRTQPSPVFRMPRMTDFMERIAGLTGDTSFFRRVADAYPSPFEHSLGRAAGWRELGLRPTLDGMFLDRRFQVDSVVVGSPADSAGFRTGDAIKAINGIAVPVAMADCRRQLLKLPAGAQVEFVIRRPNGLVLLRLRR